MDVYATAFLSAVVESLLRPSQFLVNRFFPTVIIADQEEIKFDVAEAKRRIAPFVSPLVQGKLVESLGYNTNTFKPAYVKDKRVFDPERPLRRAIGEAIGGSGNPGSREQMNLVREVADQVDMLMRRKEVMASEALRAGTVTVTGEGYGTVVVNFGRAAGHTITLSGASRWGQAGIKPLDNIQTWTLTVLQSIGAQITDVVMDVDAWNLFKADADVKAILDNRRGTAAEAELAAQPVAGEKLVAVIDMVRYWLYNEWYVDDAGVEQKVLPNNTVILGSSAIEGIQHHGAIRDARAGYQAMEFFPKSWIKEDPAVRYLMMQSAPLVVPYRPNASLAATVN